MSTPKNKRHSSSRSKNSTNTTSRPTSNPSSRSEISMLRYQNFLLKRTIHNMATGLMLSRYPTVGANNRISRDYIYSKYSCSRLMEGFDPESSYTLSHKDSTESSKSAN